MIKITSNILFVSWFVTIIVLDRVAKIFDISIITMSFVLLIISGIFLYAIHRVNTGNKNDIKKYVSSEE